MKAGPRLPFDDLFRASGLAGATVTSSTFGGVNNRGATYQQSAPMGTFAEFVGCSLRTVQRWATEGVPLEKADAACVALGLHPAEVWGDAWMNA